MATQRRKDAAAPLSQYELDILKVLAPVGALPHADHGRPGNPQAQAGEGDADAAEMLRIDLEPAGVEYVVEGTDGPLYADFHSLRHSYIALLDKSGATLKEAMQLARHSDPRLTMAVYGRARLQ